MDRPAPDALLIAAHVDEWPKDAGHMYLYKMAPASSPYYDNMRSQSYAAPGGVAYTDARSTVYCVFEKEDMVRLHMVYAPDEDVADIAQPFLGRDVDWYEWENARTWLDQQNKERQDGSHACSDSQV